VTWWRRLFSRRTLDDQLERELADHFERQVRDDVRAGMSEPEARRHAAYLFGGKEVVKEECRDVRGTQWVTDILRDARQAVRQMRKRPAETVVATLSLGLGIGATAAMFSLVDAVLLRRLPVASPDQLVLLGERTDTSETSSWSLSQFRSFAASPSLSGVCAFRPRLDFGINGDDGLNVATGQLLSGSCARTLGVRTQLGRFFTEEDDRASDSNLVAVISDGFWRRHFGADPNIVGRSLSLNGYVVSIVGVTWPDFSGLEPGRMIDVSLPIGTQSWSYPGRALANPNTRWLRVIGRLAPETPRVRAASELEARWAQFAVPGSAGPAPRRRFELLDGAQGLNDLRTQFSRPLRLLFGAAGLLLLLVCANLAGLTLARNRVRVTEVTASPWGQPAGESFDNC
jgi:hypothetical protein